MDVARYGVRANPPRSSLGSLPLVGRVEPREPETQPEIGNRKPETGVEREKKNWWYVGGLGARGLVYHGVLGAIVADAAPLRRAARRRRGLRARIIRRRESRKRPRRADGRAEPHRHRRRHEARDARVAKHTVTRFS